MRLFLLTSLGILFCNTYYSQNSVSGNVDPVEVRYIQGNPYDLNVQQVYRSSAAWQNFLTENGTWYVHFNEVSGMPHRGYGRPLEAAGSTLAEKSISFANTQLHDFGIPLDELVQVPQEVKGKYTWINYRQHHNGIRVIDSRYMTKFYNGKIVGFSCEVFPSIDINETPSISPAQAALNAHNGISNNILSTGISNELVILPVPNEGQYVFHLAYSIIVNTISGTGIPSNYETYVDAHTGDVLSRRNTVMHMLPGNPGKPVKSPEQVLVVTAAVTGEVYENHPYEQIITSDMENIYITVAGIDYQADQNGTVEIPVNPGSTATIQLKGPWSRVYTDGTTPSTSVSLLDGLNNINLDGSSNIKERSAYRSVQKIHDFMRFWMPVDFDGMDFQLTTNIDEAGECNAFYDGASINFYDIGGGCNATSLVADICYHEYGHGINDNYYESIGSNFINGSMGEGYADFWAIACTNSPQLGIGFYTDNMEPLRRYDLEPMVYPDDISGEVHNDGEIIMGAWWDTHLLLGSDWNITMPLFVETYAGMQAEISNGNEGVAYTDVLIDALQADDDDGDITNGTPNGNAIVEGFYVHGITLISNAVLEHDAIEFAAGGIDLELEATLDLQFPFYNYLENVHCFYKINTGNYTSIPMESSGDDEYATILNDVPSGSVVYYYFGAYDINGSLSAVTPVASHLSQSSNIPYITLVGVVEVGSHDCDDNSDFGNWQTGVSGDNATTGEWEEDTPIGSFTVDAAPGTMVQTDSQHTPGGEFCFLTGNASNEAAGIGENDVDGGKTTLQTPVIDMSGYGSPIVSYWRYYTNNPPGGANPGQDYWQVRISNDGGANWTYVENTKTADMQWRRFAFRVADYLNPTTTMRMQFIASDSLQVGQNLDGGSLVEAALDDFIIYDELIIGIDEMNDDAISFEVYPNPVKDNVNLRIQTALAGQAQLKLYTETGQLVYSEQINLSSGLHQYSIPLPQMASGIYRINLQSEGTSLSKSIVVYP